MADRGIGGTESSSRDWASETVTWPGGGAKPERGTVDDISQEAPGGCQPAHWTDGPTAQTQTKVTHHTTTASCSHSLGGLVV